MRSFTRITSSVSLLMLMSGCGGQEPPETYGFYVLDGGGPIEVSGIRVDTSPRAQFLLFDPAIDIMVGVMVDVDQVMKIQTRTYLRNRIWHDLQSGTVGIESVNKFHVGYEVAVGYKPVESNREMLLMVPRQPIETGTYMLSVGQKEFTLFVNAGDWDADRARAEVCVDVHTERKGHGFSSNDTDKDFVPCSELDSEAGRYAAEAEAALKAGVKSDDMDSAFAKAALALAVSPNDSKLNDAVLVAYTNAIRASIQKGQFETAMSRVGNLTELLSRSEVTDELIAEVNAAQAAAEKKALAEHARLVNESRTPSRTISAYEVEHEVRSGTSATVVKRALCKVTITDVGVLVDGRPTIYFTDLEKGQGVWYKKSQKYVYMALRDYDRASQYFYISDKSALVAFYDTLRSAYLAWRQKWVTRLS